MTDEETAGAGHAVRSPDPETVQMLYEIARAQLADLSADWASLDGKALQVLGAGGIVLGVAGLGFSGWTPWLAAAAAFLGSALAAVAAAWPRDFVSPFSADRLLAYQWFEAPETLRYALLHTAAQQSIPANRAALGRKAKLVAASAALFAAEAALIGLWALSAA